MWGISPISRITINNRECRLLRSQSKFVYLAVLRPGYNTLNISLSQSIEDLKLMSQVYFVQLPPRPSRLLIQPISLINSEKNGY